MGMGPTGQSCSATAPGHSVLDGRPQARITLVQEALAAWSERDVRAFVRQFGLFTDDLRAHLLVPEADR
jgi:hypothetical protein